MAVFACSAVGDRLDGFQAFFRFHYLYKTGKRTLRRLALWPVALCQAAFGMFLILS